MVSRWDLSDEEVDAAIDYVMESGAADRGQTVNYTRVLKPLDCRHRKSFTRVATAKLSLR